MGIALGSTGRYDAPSAYRSSSSQYHCSDGLPGKGGGSQNWVDRWIRNFGGSVRLLGGRCSQWLPKGKAVPQSERNSRKQESGPGDKVGRAGVAAVLGLNGGRCDSDRGGNAIACRRYYLRSLGSEMRRIRNDWGNGPPEEVKLGAVLRSQGSDTERREWVELQPARCAHSGSSRGDIDSAGRRQVRNGGGRRKLERRQNPAAAECPRERVHSFVIKAGGHCKWHWQVRIVQRNHDRYGAVHSVHHRVLDQRVGWIRRGEHTGIAAIPVDWSGHCGGCHSRGTASLGHNLVSLLRQKNAKG